MDPSYRCSACGLVTQMEDDWDAIRRFPSIDAVPEDERWRICPEEGPEQTFLWDAADHSHQRIRNTFVAAGRTTRVCTRQVRLADTADGKPGFTIGCAIGLEDIIVEWGVRDLLERGGTQEPPDLARLLTVRFLGMVLRAHRSKDGKYFGTVSHHSRFTAWWQKLFRSEVLRRVDPQFSALELARALFPTIASGMRSFDLAARTRLWMPLDLRFSLEEQMEGVLRAARRVQGPMLRLAGRKAPYQRDPEIAYRNLYCYLLAEKANWTSKQIAADVFPGERGGQAKVRKILRKMRELVAEARATGHLS